MPGLSFLNPLYLAGLALVAIPLAVHLLSKKNVREISFSDLRFLKEAVVNRRRQFHLENRRLLLLRLLVFLLLILAVAKPVVRFSKTRLLREGERSASVIVLDHSYSMSCIENGVKRFDRAKRVALDILEGLKGEDLVSLILAAEEPVVVYQNLPVAQSETRASLEASEVSWRSSDLAQALALAEGILREAKADHREVYVISDLQQKAFEKVSPPGDGAKQDLVDLYLLAVGFPDTGNLALAEAERRPSRVSAKSECRLVFKGFAYGDTAPRFVSLTLQSQGRASTETSLPVKPQAPFSQSFTERVGDESAWLAEARLEDDVLLADNKRYVVIPIEEPGRALLVEGDPRLRKKDWDTFYFERALKIYSTGLSGGRPMDVFVQAVQSELDRLDTSGFDLIVLANVPRISREIIRKLENFVSRGGNLIVSFGARVDLPSYNERLVPNLIPFQLRRVVYHGNRQPFRISAFQDKQKPLAIFSQSNQGDLTLPLFTHFVSAREESGGQAAVLAQFETEDVALFEKKIDRGRVLGWMSSLNAAWNDFPLRPLYLPLWGEIVEYLEESSAPSVNVEVGQTVEIAVDFSLSARNVTTLKVLTPDDKVESFEVDPSQGTSRVYFTNTETPGFYRLQLPEEKRIMKAYPTVFAVNVSAGESDLTRASDEEIAARLAGWTVKRIKEPQRARAEIAVARSGKPLWDVFLLVLLLGVLFETVYANRVWR